MMDYDDSDSSPAVTLSAQAPQDGGKSDGLMSKSISAGVETGRSPTLSPVEVPHSPVTTGRLRRSCSLRKLLHSPGQDPSPSKGPERPPGSLALKRPSFLAYEDENSSDSGYASLPLPTLPKRSRFKSEEDPSVKENVVDNWFSGFGAVGASPSPSLSFKSNNSSLDLDCFPLEMIAELPEEEEGEGTGGFTSLLSNTILVSQPCSSSTPTLRRSTSLLNPELQYSPQSQTSQGGFKKPSVPVRQAGPITRSMLKSQNENRKRLVELKEDMPDVLPDGSR